MRILESLFDNNRRWVAKMREESPGFFSGLVEQQEPDYLWIGCSDSRVPANQIVDLKPGDLFVHRNVANVVAHADINCLSVIQYAVDVLKVEHIIVCGHYGCGGVLAALRDTRLGLIDEWLRHVQDVRDRHQRILDQIDTENEQWRRLCELNVLEQVANVSRTTLVEAAWERGQSLSVHGWIYGIADGLLKDLSLCVTSREELDAMYDMAVGD
ncbi:MAG TPA: carbonate dehydratase [Thermoanaerobaculia bacterium]|nr:carbonate dehydratase [Thermoanaerobaculia bacterium]